MAIQAGVTNNQIQASVSETQIDVSVSGGFGPSGLTGPAGTTTWAGITGKPTTVAGFGITDAVVTSDSRLSDSREWSASTVTQAAAEAGSSTSRFAFTPQRVFQAIAAWWAASSAKTKLDGIENGATANATDAQLRDRATHTGTQTLATISDAGTAASRNVAATGDASSTQVVLGNDTRLSDARVPLAHSHNASDITSGRLNNDRMPLAIYCQTVGLQPSGIPENPGDYTMLYVNDGVDNTGSWYADGHIACTGITIGGVSLATTLAGKAASTHAHGNITNAGAIGSTSGQIVVTTTGGAVTTAATIAASQVLVGDGGTPNYGPTDSVFDAILGLDAFDENLSPVAISGSYTDLLDKPAAYSLPTASSTVTGGVRIGSGVSIDGSGVISVSTAYAATSHTHTASAITDFNTAAATAAPVQQVAGRTGSVTLTHADVGNAPATLTQFTTSQNNLSLGTGGIVRISSNAAVNITGFSGGVAGDARLLSNVGSFAITLKHADTGSTVSNRILCVGNADVEIAAGGSAVVYYDGVDSRWRVG